MVLGRAEAWGATRSELWFHYLLVVWPQAKHITSQNLVSPSVKWAGNPYLTVYHMEKTQTDLTVAFSGWSMGFEAER